MASVEERAPGGVRTADAVRRKRGGRVDEPSVDIGTHRDRGVRFAHGVISGIATLGGRLEVVADLGDDTMVLDVLEGERAS